MNSARGIAIDREIEISDERKRATERAREIEKEGKGCGR